MKINLVTNKKLKKQVDEIRKNPWFLNQKRME